MANDPLKQTLIDRYMDTTGPTAGGLTAPTGLPVPPPSEPSRVPPAWQRYLTGLKMQNAYANNWNPNPMLVRATEGK